MLLNWREVCIGKISVRFFFLRGHDRAEGDFYILASKEANKIPQRGQNRLIVNGH